VARSLKNRSPPRRKSWQLLPWIDMSQTQWATLRVDRAEPLQSGLTRPDNAFLAEQGRLLVGWPTKLALAPDFADRVLIALERDGIRPACRPATRAAQTRHGRTGLGATAAMSLPTLHDLHRPLGSTGLLVSPLGLGTVKLGRDQGVKYPNGFRFPTTTKRACCCARPPVGHQPDRHRAGLWPQRGTPGPVAARPAPGLGDCQQGRRRV
jgi:hypothetical protein